jgi:hypothetical protein
MKKLLALFALAFAGVAAVPDTGEAGIFRRRCRPQPQCCQQVVPVCPPTAAPSRSVTIKGKTYRLSESGDQDPLVEEIEKETLGADTGGISDRHRYTGKSRRVAKTTIFVEPGNPVPFSSVTQLIASFPSDAEMGALDIPRGTNSNRVEQEKRNVVVDAFLYAYKKEPDNDYHVIIGDPPSVPVPTRKYLNVEISGIPVGGTDANRDKLWEVRNAFRDGLDLGHSGPGSYEKPDPPIPVRVTGSLFFDVDHAPPRQLVGPASHKPKTAWEIHPISKFEFLD